MSDGFAGDEFDQLHCDVCGHSFERDDLVEFQGSTMCGACKRETVGRMEAGGVPLGTGGDLPPWERRHELGWAAAFFQTLKQVIVEPGAFFERMDKTSTTKDCLGFAVLVTLISSGFGWLCQTAIVSMIGAAGAAAGGDPDPLVGMLGMQGVQGCILVVVSPITAIIGVYFMSACIHGFLLVTKNAAAPFQQTLRGVCYAAAPGILQGIPLVGMAASLYQIVCQVFMVMRVHRVSGGVATLSVLWVVLLGCCAGFAVLMIVGASMFGAAASGA